MLTTSTLHGAQIILFGFMVYHEYLHIEHVLGLYCVRCVSHYLAECIVCLLVKTKSQKTWMKWGGGDLVWLIPQILPHFTSCYSGILTKWKTCFTPIWRQKNLIMQDGLDGVLTWFIWFHTSASCLSRWSSIHVHLLFEISDQVRKSLTKSLIRLRSSK